MSYELKYHKSILLVFTLIGIFLINVELTAVNLGLSQIAEAFNVPMGQTSKILSLYLIFFAVFTVVGGKLGDVLGRRSMIGATLAVFIIASLIGGAARNYMLLLFARSLQGFSAGAALPNLTGVLYDSFALEKKHKVIGLISAVVGLGTASGPLIGAAIIHYSNWRYIFYLNLPLAGVSLLGIIYALPSKSISKTKGNIDFKGLILTALFILTLVYSIHSVATLEVGHILLSSILCAVLFIVWFIHHRYYNKPFLSLNLFKNKTYAIGCVIRMFLGYCYYVLLFVLGVYAQHVLHVKTNLSGFVYLPMTVSVILASLLYSRVLTKVGLPNVLRGGLFLFLIGALVFSLAMSSLIFTVLALIIMGSGYGLLYSALFSLTLTDIKADNTTEAAGSLYFFNLFGGAVGVAVTGVLLFLFSGESIMRTLSVSVYYMVISCSTLVFISLLLIMFLIPKEQIENGC